MADSLETAAMIMAVRVDKLTRELLPRKKPEEIRDELIEQYKACYDALKAATKTPPGKVTSGPNPFYKDS